MFVNHQPIIEKYAKQNSDNFFQVLQFTLLTIQQSLHTTPEMMIDVNQEGIGSRFLWGGKLKAWAEMKHAKDEIYDHAMMLNDMHADPAHASSELLGYLASLPGLGLVKGGFVAQLAFGLVGCLDSHNIVRYGLQAQALAAAPYKRAKTHATRQAKVRAYLALCDRLGGCGVLWDTWCEYVYTRDKVGNYVSAYDVSAVHCNALGLSA